jgi:AraC family transcriptional activator of mtrCDE
MSAEQHAEDIDVRRWLVNPAAQISVRRFTQPCGAWSTVFHDPAASTRLSIASNKIERRAARKRVRKTFRMRSVAGLATLLSSFDSAVPALTLLRVAPEVRVTGPPVDGVAALLVLSGTLRLEIAGERVRMFKPGRLIFVPAAQTVHLSTNQAPQATVDSRQCLVRRDGWLVVDATLGGEAELVVAAGQILSTGTESLASSVVSTVTQCRIGKPIFSLLRAECANREVGQPTLANALMNACVVQGLRRAIGAAPAAPVDQTPQRSLFARAVAAIRARPGASHTIDTLAKTAGMSRSSFVRHFRRTMRVAPAEYIRQARLDEARVMLASTDLPIKTIAEQSGFSNRSHFSRAFRTAFGRDPSSYREITVGTEPATT